MTIVRFGEQMIVKAMSILVFPQLVGVLMLLLALYLIRSGTAQHWKRCLWTLHLQPGKHMDDPVAGNSGNGVLVSTALPIISSFAVAKREEYGDNAERDLLRILAFAHIMMVLTVMFFVFSCVLSLTPASLAAAKRQISSILSSWLTTFTRGLCLTMASIIAIIAITKSFLGHYLGAREGFNGMVIKSLRGKGKSIEINKLNRITALFMLVTTWIVATSIRASWV